MRVFLGVVLLSSVGGPILFVANETSFIATLHFLDREPHAWLLLLLLRLEIDSTGR